jgi:NTE family protein
MSMTEATSRAATTTGKPTCVLVLQGGGALGAYHIGAYQALAEKGFHPDWVCGISIGAINAAVIAGNPPDQRVQRLDDLWEFISRPALFAPFGGEAFHWLYNTISNTEALMFGQPNFFVPRAINPYLAAPGPEALSFYDTSPLRFTLRRFADFDAVNNKNIRLSLGATDIETGELVFFDNTDERIGPEHVMASGSLPPGFPPTMVGDRLYWDGGCVSNTPLETVLKHQPPGHTVVFMIDLWSGAGKAPTTMNDVLWREKQIQYASRVTSHIDAVAAKLDLKRAMALMKAAGAPGPVPGEGQGAAGVGDAVPDDAALTIGDRLDIVHVVYHPTGDQIPSSDAEFSRSSIAARRAAGYDDMAHAIEAAPWFAHAKPDHAAAVVHRVEKHTVVSRTQPDLRRTTGLSERSGAGRPTGGKAKKSA